jgi:hypothetical protein
VPGDVREGGDKHPEHLVQVLGLGGPGRYDRPDHGKDGPVGGAVVQSEGGGAHDGGDIQEMVENLQTGFRIRFRFMFRFRFRFWVL